MLFVDFADAVGLEYVVQSVADSEATTVDEYVEYIIEVEGFLSPVGQALFESGGRYGVINAWSWCSDAATCGAGVGDCDRDSHCDSGLVCHHDVGADYGLSTSMDICAPPAGDWSYCDDMVCLHGDGDCDGDSDCDAIGDGRCVNDVGASFGFNSGVDVCLANGTSEYCHPGDPCGSYEGDCDTDNDCESGHFCEHNVGAAFGFDSRIDICTPYTDIDVIDIEATRP